MNRYGEMRKWDELKAGAVLVPEPSYETSFVATVSVQHTLVSVLRVLHFLYYVFSLLPNTLYSSDVHMSGNSQQLHVKFFRVRACHVLYHTALGA